MTLCLKAEFVNETNCAGGTISGVEGVLPLLGGAIRPQHPMQHRAMAGREGRSGTSEERRAAAPRKQEHTDTAAVPCSPSHQAPQKHAAVRLNHKEG